MTKETKTTTIERSTEKTFAEIRELVNKQKKQKQDDGYNQCCRRTVGSVSMGDGNWMSVPHFLDD